MAFGVSESAPIKDVLGDYTQRMYQKYGAIHHLDVLSGAWIYRVFFLASTLQVDLAFAPQSEFGARASTFKLVFGKAEKTAFDSPSASSSVMGWAWLYALHVRSCIQRDQNWRAEYMITAMRNQVMSLSCLRLGLPERQGRGLDSLPRELKARFERCLVRSLEREELQRAYGAVMEVFIQEIRQADPELSPRLEPSLRALLN